MKHTWTTYQLELLREKYPDLAAKELAILFPDKTVVAIHSKAKTLGLKKRIQRRYFTAEDIEIIKEKFPIMHTAELAKLLSCGISALSDRAYKLGLKKEKFIQSENGRKVAEYGHAYRFVKGSTPPNKGKRQVDYMSAEAIERTKATRFKKGNTPLNYRPIGSERINVYGYIEIKTKEGLHSWRLKHREIWEAANGKIEKGNNIQFKDKNPLNCTLDNLYIISRSKQIEDNSIIRYPTEVRQLIRSNSKLKRTIKKHKDEEYRSN